MTRRALVPIVVCACLSATAAAQVKGRDRSKDIGPWRPWSFNAQPDARRSTGATPAEVQAFQARLQELAAIVKRAPAVSTPVGFAAEMWGSLDSYYGTYPGSPPARAVPLSGNLTFGAFLLFEFEENGRIRNEDMKGGETETLGFEVNDISSPRYGGTIPDGWSSDTLDADAFVEPPTGAPIAGIARIGDTFVVRNNTKPLWVPFALADALKPIQRNRLTAFESARDEYAKRQAEFELWKSPARRAARRADWQKGATMIGGQKGAEFLAGMEKTEPQIEAQQAADVAPGGPLDKKVRAAEREQQEIEGIVAALSADDRRAPSCYDRGATRLADRFRTLEGARATCRPLVKPNPDYFDPKLPRSAPQVVMLSLFTRCLDSRSTKNTTRAGCTINRELVNTMDWDAVRAWLDH
jgi:hypothetical protein